MHDYLPFIVVGLVTGGVYCLASLGLVLTYRTSGIFNFAHGGIGMMATYVFYSLRQHMPTGPAVALAVLVVAPLMGVVIDRVLFRRLSGGGTSTYVVASLGLLVGLQSLAILIYGPHSRTVDSIFPKNNYRVAGVNVGVDQTLVVVIALAAALGLVAFFRFTRLGLQTRAVVSDRALTSMTGINASFVTTVAWMLGSAFAALSGILFAPFIGLDALRLVLLVMASFGAAAMGRLVSFPLAVAGAFGLAVVQGVATKVVGELGTASLAGLPTAVPYLGLLVSLLFARKGSLPEIAPPSRVKALGARRRRARFPFAQLGLLIGVTLALPPFLKGYRIVTLTATLAMVLVFVSLSLLVGLSRQVSLCHSVFLVFGATTLAKLLDAGVPYVIALPLSAALFVPVGALIAIPSIRLSGLYLALATFGFAVLSQDLLFTTRFAFGETQLVKIPRPGFLMGDTRFLYFTLAVVVLGIVVVEAVRVSRLGQILVALADSPKGVQSLGISPLVARVLTFCLSAFLAALAGGLLGSLVQSVSQDTYPAFLSLVWLAVLVTAGARTLGGSILAAAMFVGVPAVFTSHYFTPVYMALYLGTGAIFLAQARNGIAGLLRLPDFKVLAEKTRWRLEPGRSQERYARAVSP